MVAAAKAAGLEIALDFAINCSPDHPWLTEHPEWFHRRPDGTLKYAENPPEALPGHLQRELRLAASGARSGARSATSSSTGSTAASPSSASTTRTPSRFRSGSG